MDRKIFSEKLARAKEQQSDSIVERCNNLADLENEFYNKYVADSDTDINYQKLVAIEEFGELQHEITKDLRGNLDRIGILEEMADVQIVIDTLRRVYNISIDELDAAIKVKLVRNKEEREKNKDLPC